LISVLEIGKTAYILIYNRILTQNCWLF